MSVRLHAGQLLDRSVQSPAHGGIITLWHWMLNKNITFSFERDLWCNPRLRAVIAHLNKNLGFYGWGFYGHVFALALVHAIIIQQDNSSSLPCSTSLRPSSQGQPLSSFSPPLSLSLSLTHTCTHRSKAPSTHTESSLAPVTNQTPPSRCGQSLLLFRLNTSPRLITLIPLCSAP